MLNYTVAPKRTALIAARITGEEPSYIVPVPENDDELAAKAGKNDDGTPKLTLLGLAQEFIATKYQAVISLGLKAGAKIVKDDKGNDVYATGQECTEAELDAIILAADPEVYRLLVGERAAGAGRQSEKAKYEAKDAERIAAQEQTFRDNFAAASSKAMRQMIVQMAQSMIGMQNVAAELEGQL